jgi:hypothetical protein
MSKKITLTNKQLMDSIGALQVLMEERIPAKTSYTIDWNADRVERETKLIAKKRMEIFRDHAEWDAKTERPLLVDGQVKWKDEAGQTEMEELMAIETEIEYRPISLDSMGNVAVPPLVFRLLRWMFEEETEKQPA